MINEKQKKEAELIGLTLLKRATKEEYGSGYPNYNLYRINKCGHEFYFQPTHVRRNNIVCKKCQEETYKQDALCCGLELIDKSEQSVYHRKYRQISCGHVFETRIGAIKASKNTKYLCHECQVIKYKKDAKNRNLEYLGEADREGIYRKYKFIECGHIRDISQQAVQNGNFECKDCVINTYMDQAKIEGLKYLGLAKKADRANKRNYELPCGCTKDLRVDHVKNSRWACDNCGDTHYTQNSNVYLLLITTKNAQWLKLGYAKNLKNRINNYGLDKNSSIILLFWKQFKKGVDALHFEKMIHSKFKKFRLKSNLMEKHQKHNGHTECYPTCITSQLLKELYES